MRPTPCPAYGYHYDYQRCERCRKYEEWRRSDEGKATLEAERKEKEREMKDEARKEAVTNLAQIAVTMFGSTVTWVVLSSVYLTDMIAEAMLFVVWAAVMIVATVGAIGEARELVG